MGEYPQVPSAWYAGITDDPNRKLYKEHKVNPQSESHHVVQCHSKEDAEEAEKYLLETHHCGGDTGGGNGVVNPA